MGLYEGKADSVGNFAVGDNVSVVRAGNVVGNSFPASSRTKSNPSHVLLATVVYDQCNQAIRTRVASRAPKRGIRVHADPRVQTRNNVDAGAQMDGTAIPRIPRLILPRNIAE